MPAIAKGDGWEENEGWMLIGLNEIEILYNKRIDGCFLISNSGKNKLVKINNRDDLFKIVSI
jgi:hypothetical protein